MVPEEGIRLSISEPGAPVCPESGQRTAQQKLETAIAVPVLSPELDDEEQIQFIRQWSQPKRVALLQRMANDSGVVMPQLGEGYDQTITGISRALRMTKGELRLLSRLEEVYGSMEPKELDEWKGCFTTSFAIADIADRMLKPSPGEVNTSIALSFSDNFSYATKSQLISRYANLANLIGHFGFKSYFPPAIGFLSTVPREVVLNIANHVNTQLSVLQARK